MMIVGTALRSRPLNYTPLWLEPLTVDKFVRPSGGAIRVCIEKAVEYISGQTPNSYYRYKN